MGNELKGEKAELFRKKAYPYLVNLVNINLKVQT